MSNSRKKKIKAFLINEKEIKTTLFADHMTCFLRDTNSYFQLQTLPYSNKSESINQSFLRWKRLYVKFEKIEILNLRFPN